MSRGDDIVLTYSPLPKHLSSISLLTLCLVALLPKHIRHLAPAGISWYSIHSILGVVPCGTGRIVRCLGGL